MKIMIMLLSFIMLLSCKKKNEIYACIGIPDTHQRFDYMYFKNANEGYLFGDFSHYQDMTEANLSNSKFNPEVIYEGTIFKTTNQGRNWIKIDSFSNHVFLQNAIIYNKSLYITTSGRMNVNTYHILKFDFNTETVQILNRNFERLRNIWINSDNKICVDYSTNNNKFFLNLDENLNILDSAKFEYPLAGKTVLCASNNYGIAWNEDKHIIVDFDKKKLIPLPLDPDELVVQDSNKLLVVGNSKSNKKELDFVSYDTSTKEIKVIKKIGGYSIVENLQSNNKVIVGFVGNIVGLFVKYDICYSLNKGATWKIKKIEEVNYVRPTSLVDNILYVFSGDARIQKIILD